jgi:ribosome-binding factor A
MQKVSNRPRRVAELIKRELAILIPLKLDSPHARDITLTGAEVSRDMSSARIYYSLLGGAAMAPQTTKALNRAAGFFRATLMERVTLRNVPALRFFFDESVERGARIDSLIDQALAEDKNHKE